MIDMYLLHNAFKENNRPVWINIDHIVSIIQPKTDGDIWTLFMSSGVKYYLSDSEAREILGIHARGL